MSIIKITNSHSTQTPDCTQLFVIILVIDENDLLLSYIFIYCVEENVIYKKNSNKITNISNQKIAFHISELMITFKIYEDVIKN